MNEIEWLGKYESDPYIVHYEVYEVTYKSTDGFLVKMYYDSAYSHSASIFKDCKGDAICQWGGALAPNCPDYKQHETYRELIYSR